jgi:hypothetical protein
MNTEREPMLHNVEHWDCRKHELKLSNLRLADVPNKNQTNDPDTVLAKALELADQIMQSQSSYADHNDPNLMAEISSKSLRLAGLVYAINKWITVEGKFPTQWKDDEKRDLKRAAKEIEDILNRQLSQGISNAANHVAACIDVLGR